MTRNPRTPSRAPAVAASAVGVAATVTGIALYAISLARAQAVADELKSACDVNALGDRSRPFSSIDHYFGPAMILAAVGVVAAIVAIVLSRRRLRVLASILAFIAGVLFLLAWYAFSQRNGGPSVHSAAAECQWVQLPSW